MSKLGSMLLIFANYLHLANISNMLSRMLSDTQTQNHRVLTLAAETGKLRASDLDAINVPRVVLARLAAAGLLEKRARGLYALPNAAVSEFETLAMVATRSPQSILCLLTALQCHELTTQLPREIWIAMPRGSHKPKFDYPPLRMIKFSSEAYAAGVEEMERDGVTLRLYNPAKTLVDCFKHRSKIGLDVALEALREARARNKATPADIWHFAKICRVTSVIRPYLESVG